MMDGGGTRRRPTTTDGLHLSNKTTKDDECLLILELSEEDPLYEKKKKLLEDKGSDPLEHVSLKSTSCPNWLDTTMQILVQRARIISLDEVEFYFDGTDIDSMEFCNPRIELEALHSILSLIDKILSTGNCTTMGLLRDLRNASVSMIQELGNKIRLDTTIVTSYSCDKEGHLLQWSKNNGIQTKLAVAYVEGAGRGAIATGDLNVGDVALDIPISVIIFEELVQESDLYPILEKVNGMSYETMLLLWSMRERHNQHSKFKLYFDSLPKVFNTGLSFGINAIMALDGTLLLEEIVQAKEHLRAQYDELFPALCLEHPHTFPAELYTWEQFLWACELWYSNSMRIMFPDGKLRTCLVPVAGFLNHSLCPHIMHYGKVDAASNSLKFRLTRPCKAGEQCYLSYGKFSSSHLVTFYGFLPQEENPYDIIPLDIDTPETGYSENGDPISDWSNHMVRGTWLSKNHGIFHYGLPTPLLDHFRRALCPTFQTNVHSQENLEIELQVLDDLHSTFEDMLETFGETNFDESENWDIKLAMEFKALQRRIISSIVTSCNSGRKLVEQELSKWRT